MALQLYPKSLSATAESWHVLLQRSEHSGASSGTLLSGVSGPVDIIGAGLERI